MSNNTNTNTKKGGDTMKDFLTANVMLFDSRDPQSAQNMGGYIYPVLELGIRSGAGTYYRVISHDIRLSKIGQLQMAIRNKNVIWGTVKDTKLITVEGDFTIGDLGFQLANKAGVPFRKKDLLQQVALVKDSNFIYGVLELRLRALHTWGPKFTPDEQYWSEDLVDLASQGEDPSGSKILKRAGFVTRPFRLSTTRSHFNVRVVPGGSTRDGIFFVSKRIRREMVERINLPTHAVAMEADFKRSILEHYMVDNGLVFGRMFDQDGTPIDGMLKGQIWYVDLPKGVDIVAPEDCIKHEMRYTDECKVAIIGGDPQGPKALRLDGQTSVNNGQVWDADRARKSLKTAGDKFFNRLAEGKVMELHEMSDDLIADRFRYDERSFNKLMKYRVRQWQAYGLDYRLSPWMTERMGKTFVESLHPKNPNTIRIPVNHGIRAQIMTQDIINLRFNLEEEALQDDSPDSTFSWAMNVDPGFIRLYKRDGATFMVVNDDDYEALVLPNHGRGDLDDFYAFYFGFVMLKLFPGVTIPVLICLATRNPNTRGEWTAWLVDPEDVPHLKDVNGDPVVPAVFSKRMWPTQLTQAIETGKVTMLELPSATDPSATAHEDRIAAAEYTNKLGDMILEGSDKGKKIEAALVNRLGFPRELSSLIATTNDGPLSTAFRIVKEYQRDYEDRLDKFIKDSQVPSFLLNPAIGLTERPQMMQKCVSLLGQARYAQWRAQEDLRPIHDEMVAMASQDATDEEIAAMEDELAMARMMAGIEAAEGVILPWIMEGHGMDRAHRALGMWLATLTTPSKAERDRIQFEHARGNIKAKPRISDQLIFGTRVFDQLLEALVFFGIAHVPYLTHMGEVKRARHVVFNGEDNSWTLTCKVGGEQAVKHNRNTLATFWSNRLRCSNHLEEES